MPEQKLSYIKYFFWWLGIIKKCPKCNARLLLVDKGGWRLYKCSNPDCDFGKMRRNYPFEIWSR